MGDPLRAATFVCPPPPAPRIPLGAYIHPGFGMVALSRDGVQVVADYDGEHDIDWYTAKVRREAKPHKATPVWTLHIDGPLASQVYAYTSDGEWSLIEKGRGFA